MTQLAPAPVSMLDDIRQGFARRRLWWFLAKRELIKQYDRTVLGVLWIPLNAAIHIAIIGYLFKLIMESMGGSGRSKYLPHFALGYAVWITFTKAIGESSKLWPKSQKYLMHIPVPLSTIVIKTIVKLGLMLCMTFPVGIAFMIIDGTYPTARAFLAIPGALVWIANLTWIVVIISVVGARFLDVGKATNNLTYMLYLGTPILWETKRLYKEVDGVITTDARWIADINPLYHMIELMRAPLNGTDLRPLSWYVAIGCAVFGNIIAFALLARVRRKIVLWL